MARPRAPQSARHTLSHNGGELIQDRPRTGAVDPLVTVDDQEVAFVKPVRRETSTQSVCM